MERRKKEDETASEVFENFFCLFFSSSFFLVVLFLEQNIIMEKTLFDVRLPVDQTENLAIGQKSGEGEK